MYMIKYSSLLNNLRINITSDHDDDEQDVDDMC